MKLASYIKDGHEQLAIVVNDILYDMDTLHPELPSGMSMFLNYWDEYFPLAKAINESITQGKNTLNQGHPMVSSDLISPVPLPASCRRAMVFSHEPDNLPQPSDQFNRSPVVYFTNHHNVQGPGDVICMPDHLEQLDFEMSVAVLISSHCRNITAEEADQYVGGYLIMNTIRVQEKPIGKDIVNVLGPWLLTPDELESFKIAPREGHTGNNFNIQMSCSVNDEMLKEMSLADMDYTFAELIAGCAYGTGLQPGDIISAGTLVTGSYLNINQNRRLNEPDYTERWLKAGDTIKIEIEGLGESIITIVKEDSEFSLLHH